ncbi:MAG: hypothetical protein ACK5LC_11995 [Coprobacillaceae bacterium]
MEEQLTLGQKVGAEVKGQAQHDVTLNRHLFTGGSDLPNILGFASKFGTTPFIWAKIKAGIIDNQFKGNCHTKYGQKMEPVIRDYINAVKDINFIEDKVIDEVNKLRSHCDGIDRDNDLLLEVKTFGNELDINYYTPQIQMYLELFDVSECLLVGYKKPDDFYTGLDYSLENADEYFNFDFDESRLVVHEVKRDKELWNKILKQVERFKKGVEVLKNNPNLSEEEFNAIYYGDEITRITNKLSEVEKSLRFYKELEDTQKQLKSKLYDLFEENNIINLDTDTLKITKVNPTVSSRIDNKKLKQEQPDLYSQYLTETKRSGYIKITLKENV